MRPRRLAAGAAVACLSGVALAPIVGTLTSGEVMAVGSDSSLEDARRAADHSAFLGVVEVRWRDAEREQAEELTVQASGGVIEVRGGNTFMASPSNGRLVSRGGRGWDLLWPPRLAPVLRPNPGPKYQAEAGVGPLVAGRPTRVVDLREGRILRERLYLDVATGLMLQREQYDQGGAPQRSISFRSVSIDGTNPAPRTPVQPADRAPHPMSMAKLAGIHSAPAYLAGGYRRLGGYRSHGLMHFLYADGLYDLSVFSQPGELRHERGGHAVAIGNRAGRWFAWPGGTAIELQADDRVITVVSDAPLDQVLRAARSLPIGAPPSPALNALREACRALIGPLG